VEFSQVNLAAAAAAAMSITALHFFCCYSIRIVRFSSLEKIDYHSLDFINIFCSIHRLCCVVCRIKQLKLFNLIPYTITRMAESTAAAAATKKKSNLFG